jgi:predicted DCC family thiol-disulfide oxidoreductase YuxK
VIAQDLEQLQDKPIVFYDGTCGFCQATVQFLLRHNKKQNLYFAPLQSGLLKQFLTHKLKFSPIPDAVFFYEQGKLYSHSEAALRITRHLEIPLSWLYYLRFIPLSFRDFVYNLVARNRYRIAGRKEDCLLPTPEQRARILE